ncbi:MAG: hypothetical protein U0V72_08205 [Cytophagales bacterium]
MKFKLLSVVCIAVLISTILQIACTSPKESVLDEDVQLYQLSQDTVGAKYHGLGKYYVVDSLNGLDSTIPSSMNYHNAAVVRVKYNKTAANNFDKSIMTDPTDVFSNNSLIVLEEYTADTATLKAYSIMYKSPSSKHKDTLYNNNWVYAKYNANGQVLVSIKENGINCKKCHSTAAKDYLKITEVDY